MKQRLWWWSMRRLVVLLVLTVGGFVMAQTPGAVMVHAGPGPSGFAATSGEFGKQWALGASGGFMSSTPDGNAATMNLQGEYFVTPEASVGPMVQLGVTDNMTMTGLSMQGRYYLPVGGTNRRGRVNVQGGLGFAHAEFQDDDTSWLIPVGVGYDYELDSGMSLSVNGLVNFTHLDTGRDTGADAMPAVTFGVQF